MTHVEYAEHLRALDDQELAHETGVALTGVLLKDLTRGDYATMSFLCQRECYRRDTPHIFTETLAKVFRPTGAPYGGVS